MTNQRAGKYRYGISDLCNSKCTFNDHKSDQTYTTKIYFLRKNCDGQTDIGKWYPSKRPPPPPPPPLTHQNAPPPPPPPHTIDGSDLRYVLNTYFITGGPLGLRVLSSPVCVYLCVSTFACPSDNSTHIPARVTRFRRKDAKHFAQGPYCFWGWLSLTFHVKFNFISKFCLFASLLRLWNICETWKNGVCWTIPHPTWRRTHSDSFICMPTGSCHGPWNSLVTSLCETIGVLPALDSAIGSGFCKLLSVSAKLYAPHIPIFHNTRSPITETTVKQRSFAFFCSVSHSLINPFLHGCQHASFSLLHILTSFVRTSPITMLTNRPWHGSWRGLGDSAL